GYMARCACQGMITVKSSGSCASRSLVWRGAPFDSIETGKSSGSCALRRMDLCGAPLRN
ncbi:hypothetical protein A2U01_0067714, partial [Trifolium medium]|nr:hypothetical protein [Trifolium medium]